MSRFFVQPGHEMLSTGSFTKKCAKVKAYITPKYKLSVSKSGFWASFTLGYLWICKANLGKSNGSRDMTFFSARNIFQTLICPCTVKRWNTKEKKVTSLGPFNLERFALQFHKCPNVAKAQKPDFETESQYFGVI